MTPNQPPINLSTNVQQGNFIDKFRDSCPRFKDNPTKIILYDNPTKPLSISEQMSYRVIYEQVQRFMAIGPNNQK
jgi:hypothetical protein